MTTRINVALSLFFLFFHAARQTIKDINKMFGVNKFKYLGNSRFGIQILTDALVLKSQP